MLKKLLDLRVILVVLLLISWGLTALFFVNTNKKHDEAIAGKDSEITSLNEQITAIGELVPAYTVAADVVSGKKIEESDLIPVDVPIGVATNLISAPEDIIGKHFKLAMTAGSVITSDCIYEQVVTSDMRYYDVMVDVLPIGLKPGAFVDIRIKFGTGADYIGIAHKQVVEINGNTLKMIVTEADLHTLSDMLVDNIVFNTAFESKTEVDENGKPIKVDSVGCLIYAIEYLEGGIQSGTSQFYAPSTLVQAIINSDPNIGSLNLTANDMVLRRNMIEAGLDVNNGERAVADNIRDVVSKFIDKGRADYEKRMQDELKAAAEEGA